MYWNHLLYWCLDHWTDTTVQYRHWRLYPHADPSHWGLQIQNLPHWLQIRSGTEVYHWSSFLSGVRKSIFHYLKIFISSLNLPCLFPWNSSLTSIWWNMKCNTLKILLTSLQVQDHRSKWTATVPGGCQAECVLQWPLPLRHTGHPP